MMYRAHADEFSYSIVETVDGDNINILIREIGNDLEHENFEVNLKLSPGDRNTWRGDFIKIVEDISMYSHSDQQFLKRLKKLLEKGRDFYNLLFRDSVKTAGEKEMLDRMFLRPSDKPGRIQVTSDFFALDYQFLVGQEFNPKQITLEDYKLFLGCQHFISKKFNSQKTKAVFSDTIRLTYISHEELKAFESTSLKCLFELDQKNLLDLVSQEEDFSAFEIMDSTGNYDGIHLACHIDHSVPHLDFGKKETIDLSNFNSLTNLDGKFIFLNGCNGGTFDAYRLENFTSKFAASRNAALVISSEIALEDPFAGEFSCHFYENLFVNHRGIVDKTLFYANLNFLKKKNLAVLYYSSYGWPYITEVN